MRILTYSHEELGDKPWVLDQWMDFIGKAISDEGFTEAHFTGELAPHETEKTAYIVYDTNRLEKINAIAFTVKYLDEDGVTEVVYLMLIAVDPDTLQQGMGTKLLKHIMAIHQESEIWVKIYRGNEASRRFFKKHGFVKTTKKAMHPRLNPSYRLPYDPYRYRYID